MRLFFDHHDEQRGHRRGRGQRPFGRPDVLLRFSPRHRGPFGVPWGGPFGDDPFGEHGGGPRRQRRGDIKYALLALLAEQPRHGYELIKALEERYGGFYRPSPGSVYPTLQLLEDEGYLTSESVGGKRVYTITEAGREYLQARPDAAAGHEWPGQRWGNPELRDLRERMGALLGTVMEVARHGSPAQLREAITLLDSTRRELYRILARDEPERPPEA